MTNVTFLRSVPLLVEFDPAELETLDGRLTTTVHAPGAIILEEGATNRALHFMREGKVRVSRRVDGTDVILSDLTAGQTFGEMSILEDGFATATLTAVTPVVILSISMNDLAAFLRESPSAGAKFWHAMALDLRKRLLQTNDVVRSYFEVNRALVENPTFREAYAMCNR